MRPLLMGKKGDVLIDEGSGMRRFGHHYFCAFKRPQDDICSQATCIGPRRGSADGRRIQEKAEASPMCSAMCSASMLAVRVALGAEQMTEDVREG